MISVIFCVQCDDSGTRVTDPGALYNNAHVLAAQGRQEEAVKTFEKALEAGLPNPMRIVSDTALRTILWNPDLRPRLRKAIAEYPSDSIAQIATSHEPGTRIQVHGRVVNGANNRPVEGARIEVTHTDTAGMYFEEDGTWNPRLFGYFLTGATGSFVAYTILPGPYLDDDGEIVPRHIHFSINAPGYREYNSEFVFEDDPLLTPQRRDAALSQGHPVATRLHAEGSYLIEIPLQRE